MKRTVSTKSVLKMKLNKKINVIVYVSSISKINLQFEKKKKSQWNQHSRIRPPTIILPYLTIIIQNKVDNYFALCLTIEIILK